MKLHIVKCVSLLHLQNLISAHTHLLIEQQFVMRNKFFIAIVNSLLMAFRNEASKHFSKPNLHQQKTVYFLVVRL